VAERLKAPVLKTGRRVSVSDTQIATSTDRKDCLGAAVDLIATEIQFGEYQMEARLQAIASFNVAY